MKHDPVLMQNFRELYKPDTWFADEGKHAVRSSTRRDFTLHSARFPAFRRTGRRLANPSEEGELYAVYDIYEPAAQASADEEVKPLLRVFTHVFRSVEEAREGFFHLLWGAGRLNGRDEGTLDVGEVSYGRDKYLSFLRNNIVIRIFNAGPGAEGVPDDFARQVDQQIIE